MGHGAAREEALGRALPIQTATLQAGLAAAGVAGVAATVVGVLLLTVPRRVLDAPTGLRRVLFETSLGQLFDRRFAIERGVYRRHRLAGALVLLGAIALAALLWHVGRKPGVVAQLRAALTVPGLHVVTVATMTIAASLGVVGTCLLVRPSVLKGLEAAVNRWIEPPRRDVHMMVSEWVLRRPRATGLVLVVAGLACLRPF